MQQQNKEKKFNVPVKTLKGFNRNQLVNFKQIYADNLIKLKKYSDTATGIGCSIDKNGLPATGLTEDVHTRNAKGQTVVSVGTRKAMETLLGYGEGTLKQGSVYWLTWNVKVDSDVLVLKYLFLYSQSIVANGVGEIEENSKAEYVLYSEEQEATQKVTARKSLKTAYALSEKLDLETKINILAIEGYNADSTAVNTIDNKIDEMIEADPAYFLGIVENSNLISMSLLSKCLDGGIITMKDGAIYHNEVILGHDKESAAEAIAKSDKVQKVLKAKLSGDMDILKEALETKETE
jgi:hypothetical protein